MNLVYWHTFIVRYMYYLPPRLNPEVSVLHLPSG